MKYLITESQHKLIIESQKKTQFFQELINNKLDLIRKECENGADNYEGYWEDYRDDISSGAETCNQMEQVENIEVMSADWGTVKHSNQNKETKYMNVKVMIYYTSIKEYGDFNADDLTYDLEQLIRKSTGMPFILNYESTNTNKNFNW
jgi:hypothetical protein